MAWRRLIEASLVKPLRVYALTIVSLAPLVAQGAELGRETLELELPEAARGRLYPFIAGLSARPRWLPRGQVAVVAHSPGLCARLAWAGSEERGHLEGQVWVAEGKRAQIPFSGPFRGRAEGSPLAVEADAPFDLRLERGIGRLSYGAATLELCANGLAFVDFGLFIEWPQIGRASRWEVQREGPLSLALWLRAPGEARILQVIAHRGISRVDVAFAALPNAEVPSATPLELILRAAPEETVLLDAKDQAIELPSKPQEIEGGLRGFRLLGRDLGPALRWRSGDLEILSLTLAPTGGEAPARITWDQSGAIQLAMGAVFSRGEGAIWRFCLEKSATRSAPLGIAFGPLDQGDRGISLPPRRTRVFMQEFTDPLLNEFLADERHGLLRPGADRGDWPLSQNTEGNLEYDTAFGLLLRGRREGGVVASAAGMAALDHLLSRDRDAAASGLFFPHGPGHRSGAIEAGHHWIEGLVWGARLGRDPLLLAALEEVLSAQAKALAAMDQRGLYPRSRGWGLWAAAIAAEIAPTKANRKIVKDWRAPLLQALGTHGHLELVPKSDANHFEVNPYIEGGILLPALAASLRALPDARAAALLEQMGKALVRDAMTRDEERRMRLVRRIDVVAKGAKPLATRGLAPGEDAALFLAGLARAGVPIEGRLLELKRDLASTLKVPGHRHQGRELSVLLRSLPWL